jgi:predicted TIM-barrel fold metal-dependent hydrolase
MKKIDFEAHFYTREYLLALSENKGYPRFVYDDEKRRSGKLFYFADLIQPFSKHLLASLLDMGEERLKVMDSLNVDVQLVSLSAPGLEQIDPLIGTALAREANNWLSEIIRRYPGRFMGYAALAPKNPEAAADELERAVKELGFAGWNTHSNYGDSYLDEKRYWPILERAERLGVPIYIHPTVPAIPQVRTYGFALGGAPFGFGMETSLCMMRLIFSGALDRFPNLKIILGHLGEAIPFIMRRLDWAYLRPMPPVFRTLPKPPSEYLKNHCFITTSGNYYQPAFRCALEAFGIDRILLGTDYPYDDPNECHDFLKMLPLPEGDKEKIYCRNATQLGISV